MVILQLDQQPILVQAIFSGELEDVRSALEFKQDVNYQDSERRTPLHAATYKGDAEVAALLLSYGARVNTKDSRWVTPLHTACCCASSDLVSLLLQHQADTTARDRHWQTPLHVAAANNTVDCVAELLDHVPNLNVADRMGRTALHNAAINGHYDVLEFLLNKGCIVNACDKRDCRPLHCAAHMGHVLTIEVLVRHGADINAKDRNQYSPLHVAAAGGRVSACRALLNAGAQVDARNAYGNSPLHIACLNGHLPVCQILLSFGANIEATNYRGQSPLHIAAASTHGVDCLNYLVEKNVDINKQSLDGRTPLHMTAIHGRFTRSKTLIDKGAVVDCTDKNGCTALHIAAQYGHDLLSNTLLSFGADPKKRGYAGRTPLHMSCLSGYVECCRKFLQAGVDLNAQDDSGKTPVHCAAYKGSVECLDLLVSNGAQFDVVDNIGRLALHYAAVQGHYPCVFTLVGLGSAVNLCDTEGCSPLHLAAAYDIKGDCVEYLLRHKADPKLKDNKGFTSIHYAVAGGNFAGLGYLLSVVGNNYIMYGPDMPLTTPLHLSARNGNQDILQLLLSYFHDTNIRAEHGSTALLLAARAGHTHCVQMLLRYGAKVSICDTIHNMSPVHYSARNGHMHCLALLLDNTEDKNVIDLQDSLQRTALMLAVSGGYGECANTLLKCGADPNIVDADKHSSLFRAVVNGQHNIVQLLISHGATLNKPDVNGKTVLHVAAGCGHISSLQMVMKHIEPSDVTVLDNQECTVLHWACHSGNPSCVSYLLEKEIFTKLEGNVFSAVHCATIVGGERCIELLCKHYGNDIVNLKDARNRTPLHIAALHGHIDCAKFLLEHGAEIDSKDSDGRTPLIAAAQNGQSQILDLFISYKADMTSYDNNGNTALHWACLKRHSHSALLLLEYIDDADVVNMINNDRKTPLHLSARNGLVNVTRQLISKGSSVLALDINGMTPALCCAPNNSVAQCLALILANYAICSQQNNAKEQSLSSPFAYWLQKCKPKKLKTFDTKKLQTDMSLVYDPDYFECQRLFNLTKGPKKVKAHDGAFGAKSKFQDFSQKRNNSKHELDQNTVRQLLKINTNDSVQEVMVSDSKETTRIGPFLVENYKPEEVFISSSREKFFGHDLHRSYSDMFVANEHRFTVSGLKKVGQDAKLKKTSRSIDSSNYAKQGCSKIANDQSCFEKRKGNAETYSERKRQISLTETNYKTVKKIAQEIIGSTSTKINREDLLQLLLEYSMIDEDYQLQMERTSSNKSSQKKTLFSDEIRVYLALCLHDVYTRPRKGSKTNLQDLSDDNQCLKKTCEETLKKVRDQRLGLQTSSGLDSSGIVPVQYQGHTKSEEFVSETSLRQYRMQKHSKHPTKQPVVKKSKNVNKSYQKKFMDSKFALERFMNDDLAENVSNEDLKSLPSTSSGSSENSVTEAMQYNITSENQLYDMTPGTSKSDTSQKLDVDMLTSSTIKVLESSNDDAIIKVDQVMRGLYVEDSAIEKMRHFRRTIQAMRSALWKDSVDPLFNETNKKTIMNGLEMIHSTKTLNIVADDIKLFDSTLSRWPEEFPQALEAMKRIIKTLTEYDHLEKLQDGLLDILNELHTENSEALKESAVQLIHKDNERKDAENGEEELTTQEDPLEGSSTGVSHKAKQSEEYFYNDEDVQYVKMTDLYDKNGEERIATDTSCRGDDGSRKEGPTLTVFTAEPTCFMSKHDYTSAGIQTKTSVKKLSKTLIQESVGVHDNISNSDLHDNNENTIHELNQNNIMEMLEECLEDPNHLGECLYQQVHCDDKILDESTDKQESETNLQDVISGTISMVSYNMMTQQIVALGIDAPHENQQEAQEIIEVCEIEENEFELHNVSPQSEIEDLEESQLILEHIDECEAQTSNSNEDFTENNLDNQKVKKRSSVTSIAMKKLHLKQKEMTTCTIS